MLSHETGGLQGSLKQVDEMLLLIPADFFDCMTWADLLIRGWLVWTMDSNEDNKKTCKDFFFGSQQHKWLASVLKRILFYNICWEKKLRAHIAEVSANLIELLRMIVHIYDQSLTYLGTIYGGFVMDWYCKMLSESWHIANTFQLPQPHGSGTLYKLTN